MEQTKFAENQPFMHEQKSTRARSNCILSFRSQIINSRSAEHISHLRLEAKFSDFSPLWSPVALFVVSIWEGKWF